MKLDDVFSKKDYLTVDEVKEIFNMATNSAYNFIQKVHEISNITGQRGMLHKEDYILFMSFNEKLAKERADLKIKYEIGKIKGGLEIE